jgi:hypothetical protein
MANQFGFICAVTNTLEQSHFWEVNSSLAGNEIPHILWKTKDHYHLLDNTNKVLKCTLWHAFH